MRAKVIAMKEGRRCPSVAPVIIEDQDYKWIHRRVKELKREWRKKYRTDKKATIEIIQN